MDHSLPPWNSFGLTGSGRLVQGPRDRPSGLAKRVLGFRKDRNQMRGSRRWKQNLLKIYIYRERERETNGVSGRLGKEKSMSLLFAWGLEFLIVIVVWCTGPLRYPGTGQSKDRGQVSFISHSFPKVGVLAKRCLEPVVLEKVYDNLILSFFRRYLAGRYHYLFITYREDICYLYYNTCVM